MNGLKWFVGIGGVIALGLSSAAAADTRYDYKFAAKNGMLNGAGTLSVSDKVNTLPGCIVSGECPGAPTRTGRTIVDMTGSFNGESISFLKNPIAPALYGTADYIGDDQLLSNSATLLSLGGVIFSTPTLGYANLLGNEGDTYDGEGPYAVLSRKGNFFGDFNLLGEAVSLAGGSFENPTVLPTGTISSVTGNIGGDVLSQLYQFDWKGGLFSSTASLLGTQADQAFNFILGTREPLGIGASSSMKLNEANNFAGTLSQNLSAGRYVIGLYGTTLVDPDFTIRFDTPIAVSSVPEPATWGMMIVGLGLAGVAARRRRQKVSTRVSYAL
jgi:hypothetical protein